MGHPHPYTPHHGQWICDESFSQNIPNNWPIWADGPNRLWDFWGIELSAHIFVHDFH